MTDKTQSQMILAMSDVADVLIEQAKHHQKLAQDLITRSHEVTKTIGVAAKEYRELAVLMPTQVKIAIETSLNTAADKAAERLASNFTAADQQAALAANRYEKAARSLGWKAGGIIVGAWVATVCIAVLVNWYTSSATAGFRKDREVLDAVIGYVKQNKASTIAFCGTPETPQLCVYIQENGKWAMRKLANLSTEQIKR